MTKPTRTSVLRAGALAILASATLLTLGCDEGRIENPNANPADTSVTAGDTTAADGTQPDTTEPGDTTDPDTTGDTGDATDATATDADIGTDTVEPDTTPPELVDTDPADQAADLGSTVRVRLVFSEPMATAAGSLIVTADGTDFATLDTTAGAWEAGDTEFVFDLTALPAGASIEVSITDAFTDVAGNALDMGSTLTFGTADSALPVVSSTVPAEGATGVAVETDALLVAFNVAMDDTMGTVTLDLGPGTLGTPDWTTNRTLLVPIDGLEVDSTYAIGLAGFASATGVAFDDTAYLGDGVLDFATGADTTAPYAVLAAPTEGQVDLDPDTFDTALVVFSEAMDTAATNVSLTNLTTTNSVSVPIAWTDARTASIGLEGANLDYDAGYALDLSALTDVAGNALDGVPLLVDGSLDFVTGQDLRVPFVLSSSLPDGAIDVSVYDANSVDLVFSEFMDTTTADVPYDNGDTTGTVPVTWGMSGNMLTVDFATIVAPGNELILDFSALVDLGGNALDPAPVLGDGRLSMTFLPPTGEGCLDPLTTADATQDATSGAWIWTFPADVFTDTNVTTCDSTSPGADLVVRYDKVSDTLANGGELLTVRANVDDFAVFQVTTDGCDPIDGATEVYCDTSFDNPSGAFDVGPGTYYITLADTSSTAQLDALELVIDEEAIPRGETCADPLTQLDAVANGDGSFTWDVPSKAVLTVDETLTCDSSIGPEVILEFQKTQADSTLSITVDNPAPSDTSLAVSVIDACDPATRNENACSTSSDSHSITASGPAGPVYIVVAQAFDYDAFQGAIVTVKEEFGSAGTTCPTGFAASGPSVAVVGSSGEANSPPSCMDSASLNNVEWYEVTANQDLVSVLGNASGALALVDPTTLAELSCATDGSTQPVSYYVGAGNTVCVGVELAPGVSSLSVDEIPYSGLTDANPTNLYIDRPGTGAGSPTSWTLEKWMLVDATNIYLGVDVTSDFVAVAPKTGGTMATPVEATEFGTSVDAHAAVFAGLDIFAVDDAFSGTDPRLSRIYDGTTTTWLTELWDPMPFFVDDSFYALTVDETSGRIWGVTDDNQATTTGADTAFYSWDPTNSATGATFEGVNDHVDNVVGLTNDAFYFYLAGEIDDIEGIFRIAKTDIANRTVVPTRLASVNVDFDVAPMFIDNYAAPSVLYFSTQDEAGVYAIEQPAGTPFFAGLVVSTGGTSDDAFFYNRTDDALYVFTTENVSTGEIWRFSR